MDTLIRDLRYAIRALVRMRVTTTIAILTLALGIGATTTVFSVVYAALLRPLPFAEPDRLVMLYTTRTTARAGVQRARWAPGEIAALGARLSSLEAVGSVTGPGVAVDSRQTSGDSSNPEQIDAEIVSPGYFRVLRVAPRIGRLFLPEEDTIAGAHPVALISTRLWRRRFASDPAILGRSLSINQVAHAVIGVLPDLFSGVGGKADVWIPTTMAPRLTYADYLTTSQHFIGLVGRLKRGVSLAQANAELEALAPQVVVDDGKSPGEDAAWSATIWPLASARIDANVRRSVLLLLAAAACLLLIACVNVASLLLARAGSRRREIAIRLALGSDRARLVRQLLTESLLLASIGGVCGTLVAAWSVSLISMPAVIPSAANGYTQMATFGRPALDRSVLVFSLGVTICTSVLCGLMPALDTSRPDLVTALKESGRTSAGAKQHGALPVLVVSEVALAVLLLAGAGLLIKSFAQLERQRGGFTTERVLSFWVNPPAFRYETRDGPAIVERLLTRIQQLPDVELAAVNRCTPFSASCARTNLSLTGPLTDPAHAPAIERHYVSADYFRALGIAVRMGRTLTDRDRPGQPPVTVINEAAARRFWPGENPIGKRVWFGPSTGFSPDQSLEVVGVVDDVRYGTVDESIGPDFYTSYLQFTYPSTLVVVKARPGGNRAASLVPSLRAAVASVEAGMPIYDVMTAEERIANAVSRPRFNALMLTMFAGAALLLAAVGVYGVMAYSVSARMRDLGVRVALGASARQVVGLVLGEGARLAGLGAAIGLIAAFALTRLMRGLLFGVAPTDPTILAASALAIVVAAMVAALAPARRASTIDPMMILRSE
jgi:putative ABC transport system permease protein